MNFNKFLKKAAFAASVTLIPFSFASDKLPAKKPNIVIILADDMGYSDLGYIGGDIQTPNLDQLAKDGILFTNFYNNAKCAPTRASLLTGLSNHKTGADHAAGNIADYGGLCIAEALEGEYVNLLIDKWHVKPSPEDLGFDRYFGSPLAPIFFWPTKLKEDSLKTFRVDDNLYTEKDMEVPLEEWYLTSEDTRFANRFIQEEIIDKKSDKPFFMFYASHAPHWPLQALKKDVDLYLDVLKDGTDAVRQKRYEYMIKNGIFDKETCKLEPAEKSWDSLSQEQKAYYERALAVHYAMVHRMDVELGNFFDFLKENGKWDNTLIFFMSDNGASGEGNPTIIPEGGLLGDRGTHARIDRIGAQMCNTPFRGNKSSLNEGGMGTPMIAHWPAGIKNPGSISHQVGHVIDLMPTILDITGIEYPKSYAGRQILAIDGQSLASTIMQGKEFDRQLILQYEAHDAVRLGDWKLYRKNKQSNNKTEKSLSKWELYKLKDDRTEQNDLANKYPEKVTEMNKMFEDWEKEVKEIQGEVYVKHPQYSPEEKAKKKAKKNQRKKEKRAKKESE